MAESIKLEVKSVTFQDNNNGRSRVKVECADAYSQRVIIVVPRADQPLVGSEVTISWDPAVVEVVL